MDRDVKPGWRVDARVYTFISKCPSEANLTSEQMQNVLLQLAAQEGQAK